MYQPTATYLLYQLPLTQCSILCTSSVCSHNSACLLQTELRERSFSVGATTRQKIDKSPSKFLSSPDIASDTSHKLHHRHSNLQINTYSIQDIATSGVIYERRLSQTSVAESDDEGNAPESMTIWRLAIQPKCILLGLATLAFVSGLSVTYQCVPPLGKQSGMNRSLIYIRPSKYLSSFKVICIICHNILCHANIIMLENC